MNTHETAKAAKVSDNYYRVEVVDRLGGLHTYNVESNSKYAIKQSLRALDKLSGPQRNHHQFHATLQAFVSVVYYANED